MKIPIRAVAFDYGNVLSRQPAAQLGRLYELTGIAPGDFRRRYMEHRAAYDRASLTGAEYWTRTLNGVEAGDDVIADLVRTDVASWLELDDRMVRWMASLAAAGLSLAILSNLPADVLAGLRRTHATWLDEFDVTVFSCEAGCAKPDPEIFARLLDALELPAADVLFIDDLKTNVESAACAGLHVVHCDSFEILSQEIERFALPALER